jgi:hypothetical protein
MALDVDLYKPYIAQGHSIQPHSPYTPSAAPMSSPVLIGSIDKVPQQANFWLSKPRSLPRSPFQQRAVRSSKRQGSPQHAIHLEYRLGPVAHEGMPATDSKTRR